MKDAKVQLTVITLQSRAHWLKAKWICVCWFCTAALGLRFRLWSCVSSENKGIMSTKSGEYFFSFLCEDSPLARGKPEEISGVWCGGRGRRRGRYFQLENSSCGKCKSPLPFILNGMFWENLVVHVDSRASVYRYWETDTSRFTCPSWTGTKDRRQCTGTEKQTPQDLPVHPEHLPKTGDSAQIQRNRHLRIYLSILNSYQGQETVHRYRETDTSRFACPFWTGTKDRRQCTDTEEQTPQDLPVHLQLEAPPAWRFLCHTRQEFKVSQDNSWRSPHDSSWGSVYDNSWWSCYGSSSRSFYD